MSQKLYVPLFTLTLILSAGLLFVVQPMFAKMILPLLGGSPQVWNTSMLFFQTVLLGGYAYAHLSSRYLSIKLQSIIHIVLIGVFFVVLPLGIPADWQPKGTENPTVWQLTTMALTVGGPFFCLSAMAPMLQRWFSKTDHKDAKNPYFLYAASNVGSVGALLAYPFLIEPIADLDQQSLYWSFGYGALLIALICISALLLKNNHGEKEKDATSKDKSHNSPNWTDRATWLLLAFIPASLMLSVTTFVTVDVASVPLVWIIPLTLYILTFVFAFARRQLIPPRTARALTTASIIFFVAITFMRAISEYDLILLVPLHFVMFFFIALSFHQSLVARAPDASHLTEFYLIMSLGGALGGVFNAIIAPYIFTLTIEHIAVFVLAVSIHFASNRDDLLSIKATKQHFIYFLAALLVWQACHLIGVFNILGLLLILAINHTIYRDYKVPAAMFIAIFLFTESDVYKSHFSQSAGVIHTSRNFYGVLKVKDFPNNRELKHGTTKHGTQFKKDDQLDLEPSTYYSAYSGIGNVFEWLDKKDNQTQKIAAIGMGVGTVACYQKPGRSFNFYEIDKNVVQIAENREYFTFLSDCGSPYEVILGDGRLNIEKANDGSYDLVIVDAFSSDNIPIHLITREAISLYLDKLNETGVLAIHISNRHMDLEPVLHNISQDLGVRALYKRNPQIFDQGTNRYYLESRYVVISKSKVFEASLLSMAWHEELREQDAMFWRPTKADREDRVWTDKYSNILSVFYGLKHFLKDQSIEEQKQTPSIVVQ